MKTVQPAFCLLALIYCLTVSGCREKEAEAFGTLEWDINRGRAPAPEIVTEIFVREGELVKAGQPLLQLDKRKQEAVVEKFRAELAQAEWLLKELLAGAREETVAELQARIEGAESDLENAERLYKRQSELFKSNFASKELLDIAENRYAQAKASLTGLREQMREFRAGTRPEMIGQAREKVAAVEAELKRARLQLADFTVKAEVQGRVEHLPYRVGDRPSAQSEVVTLLVGASPWARIYVPERYRSRLRPEGSYKLGIDGQEKQFTARLRYLAVRPSFTPFYALTERDRSRLVYVGEFVLEDEAARNLTAGTPVQLLLGEM